MQLIVNYFRKIDKFLKYDTSYYLLFFFLFSNIHKNMYTSLYILKTNPIFNKPITTVS